MPRTSRAFTDEFQRDAVQLVKQPGAMVTHRDDLRHLSFSSAQRIVNVLFIGDGGWTEGESHFTFIELESIKLVAGWYPWHFWNSTRSLNAICLIQEQYLKLRSRMLREGLFTGG